MPIAGSVPARARAARPAARNSHFPNGRYRQRAENATRLSRKHRGDGWLSWIPRRSVPAARTAALDHCCRPPSSIKREPVLEALASLRDAHPFHYTIVGDGLVAAIARAARCELGLHECVTFTGFLDREPLQALLSRASLHSDFSNASRLRRLASSISANACGCPVIGARRWSRRAVMKA
jgi:hypothetical protein